mgnify:CR=1 FL=1
MGLPLSNGKLAVWLFLVTEIMFFTALIGVYDPKLTSSMAEALSELGLTAAYVVHGFGGEDELTRPV